MSSGVAVQPSGVVKYFLVDGPCAIPAGRQTMSNSAGAWGASNSAGAWGASFRGHTYLTWR